MKRLLTWTLYSFKLPTRMEEVAQRRQYSRVSYQDKQRILRASRNGESLKDVATTLNINYRTVQTIARRDSSPEKERGHRQKKLGSVHSDFLRERIRNNPTLTLRRMKELLHEHFDISVSISTIDRHLDGIHYSVKKLTIQPRERNEDRVKIIRQSYAEWMNSEGLGIRRIYLDETNYNIWISRSIGRSERGQPAISTRPSTRGANLNIIAAMDVSGLQHYQIYKKVTHLQFNQFLLECSAKIEGDERVVFVFDNAPCHKRANEVTFPVSHSVKYLPPYSPFFNPIEEMIGQLKSTIKRYVQENIQRVYQKPENMTLAEHRFNILRESADLAFTKVSAIQCANYDRHQMEFLDRALAKDDL